MFERYTEKARRSIFFARYEASAMGIRSIETNHLLLGLLREDRDLHPIVGDVETLRKELDTGPAREKISTSVDLPLSHTCKMVLAFAGEEAENHLHKSITTLHMLAGILRTPSDDLAHSVLARRGVTLDAIRARMSDHYATQDAMKIRRNHYVLAVHSLTASSEFYQRALGFTEIHNDGNWCFLKRDNCTIMLGECRDAIPASQLGDHSYFGYLVVDSADSFYAQCQEQNVEITSPISDKPWRMREFGIRTPDGHRITIGHEL